MIRKKYDAVGIGNAIVDVLAHVEDDFLKTLKLEKGTMKLVDEFEIGELHRRIKAVKESSGGSAANTIAGLASLGNRVAFIGKVRDDNLGRSFENGLRELGVVCCTGKSARGSTACCLVLTTPDAQRTMNTCLGIAGMLGPRDIDKNIISDSSVIYLEGYLWDRENAKKAFVKAVNITKKNGGLVALSLSDRFCVDRHRDDFINLIRNHVDLLFANEDEIKSLFEVTNFRNAVKRFSDFRCVFAITRGHKGSFIVQGDRSSSITAEKGIPVVDTTGAGDLYAAGFLHGYIRGKDIAVCGRMGNAAAAEVIGHLGARPGNSLRDVFEKVGLY
ncbi:MAG: adenosine kinase [Actinobacteria bacterium]|nr:adenosine kinase [Actinomycetota bacterium]